MIYSRVITADGVVRVPIQVAVQRSGLPQFIIQGLPSSGGVRRVRQTLLAALSASGFSVPRGRVVVDCALPSGRVRGLEGLGLAIAVAVCPPSWLKPGADLDVVGQVQLDGSITLPDSLVAAAAYRPDLAVVTGVPSEKVAQMFYRQKWQMYLDLKALAQGESQSSAPTPPMFDQEFFAPDCSIDPLHLLCLSLAWAGGHSLLLFGSPGEGKTYSRLWFEALAPNLSLPQEQTRSVLRGEVLPVLTSQVEVPPPTAPLQSWENPQCGWLVRGTHGALWLDELPATSAAVRTRLRGWIESNDALTASLARRGWSTTFVATMNPCPCGYWGEPQCVCSRSAVAGVFKKVSWPLLDRFALQWRVESVLGSSLASERQKILTEYRQRIQRARHTQELRNGCLNAHTAVHQLSAQLRQVPAGWRPRLQAWSPRRQVQFLQVAQTLLDGEWSESVELACQQAWLLCRGTEFLKAKTTGS